GASRRLTVKPLPFMSIASEGLVAWWCGVLAEGHRPGLQIRVAQEAAYEAGRSTDAAPVVVPQRRYQPRAVGGEHQVGQRALPERPGAVLAPDGGLFWSCLNKHVVPSRVQGHLRCIGEDGVISAGVEVSQPPRLVWRLFAQQRQHGPVVRVLAFTSGRQQVRGVAVEDRRNGSGDGPTSGRTVSDPGDLGGRPDPPRTAIPGPRDHATSLETSATALIDRTEPLQPSLIPSLIHVRAGPSIRGHRTCARRQGDQDGPSWTMVLNPEKRKVGGSTPP